MRLSRTRRGSKGRGAEQHDGNELQRKQRSANTPLSAGARDPHELHQINRSLNNDASDEHKILHEIVEACVSQASVRVIPIAKGAPRARRPCWDSTLEWWRVSARFASQDTLAKQRKSRSC